MAKLIYQITKPEIIEDNREIEKITFDIPEDMNINEFKIICTRLASAMGYQQTTIDKAFNYNGK